MKNQVLWYNTEAKTWVEALPIGNGQMAALMFGNPTKERIALNIANLWSGDGRDKANVNQNIINCVADYVSCRERSGFSRQR